MSSLALVSLVVSATVATVAPDDRVGVALGLSAASPSALGTGLLLGPSVAADWATGLWRIGMRAHLGLSTEHDLTWEVSHVEVRAAARAGVAVPWGRGEAGLGFSAGVLLLSEARARHQSDRLDAAGLEAERSASTVGPYAALDGRVRLFVLDPWAIALEGGPNLTLLSLGADTRWVLGWSAALAVSYAL